MTSDKIDKMEKERKAAEASQKAEKEEKEAKIKRQEKLVKLLVFGGFVFVIIYNLAKSANEMTKKDSSVILKSEPSLEKCEKELLARNSCRKEVEDLCSALGIKVFKRDVNTRKAFDNSFYISGKWRRVQGRWGEVCSMLWERGLASTEVKMMANIGPLTNCDWSWGGLTDCENELIAEVFLASSWRETAQW